MNEGEDEESQGEFLKSQGMNALQESVSQESNMALPASWFLKLKRKDKYNNKI